MYAMQLKKKSQPVFFGGILGSRSRTRNVFRHLNVGCKWIQRQNEMGHPYRFLHWGRFHYSWNGCEITSVTFCLFVRKSINCSVAIRTRVVQAKMFGTLHTITYRFTIIWRVMAIRVYVSNVRTRPYRCTMTFFKLSNHSRFSSSAHGAIFFL